MSQGDPTSSRAQDKLRQEASAWFARMRGPNADRHRGAFDTWRKADPQHQAVYDRLLQRWDDAAVLTRSQSPRLGIGQHHRSARRRRARAWGLGLGGLVTGCAALALILAAPGPAGLAPWIGLAIGPAPLATRVGEIRTVRLSDGSLVTLDTDTAVSPRFSPSTRNISLLRGRARFDVAHDPTRPFVVRAGDGAVAAHGTLFDVSLASDKEVSVTLLRGAVEIETATGVSEWVRPHRPALRLSPGQELAYGRAIATPDIRPATPSAALWPSGLLSFKNTPLAEVVAEANRYARHHIVLSDPALDGLQVSGVFRATAPQDLAASLAAAFNLHLAAAPNGDLLLSRPSPVGSAPPMS